MTLVGLVWRSGPFLLKIGGGELYLRAWSVDIAYETAQVPEIACAVGGGLVLLGAVWYWAFTRRGSGSESA